MQQREVPSSRELLVELQRHERATERQSKFDRDVAAALIRILRGETRGVARGRADEVCELLKGAAQ
jgi:hypothetical protein